MPSCLYLGFCDRVLSIGRLQGVYRAFIGCFYRALVRVLKVSSTVFLFIILLVTNVACLRYFDYGVTMV